MTYSGFANYETWLVAMWIGDAQERREYCRSLAELAMAGNKLVLDDRITSPEGCRNTLAVGLRCFIEEGSPVRNHSTIYAALMHSALREVDWHELAEKLIAKFEEGATP